MRTCVIYIYIYIYIYKVSIWVSIRCGIYFTNIYGYKLKLHTTIVLLNNSGEILMGNS